jgi:stage III sporulation protein AC
LQRIGAKKLEIILVFKIAALGIIIGLANIVLEKIEKKDISMLVTLAGVMLAIFLLIPELKQLLGTIFEIFDLYG